MTKRFGLLGAAGFIAPRHMKAIKETGNTLTAALDPHDCVGILDSYFPAADFFTEYERFDRHVDKLKRRGEKLDYISVCTPNYLHDAHIRFSLRNGIHCICEKPAVLTPRNIPPLLELERETGTKAYTVLQLRLHPAIVLFKHRLEEQKQDSKVDLDLTYITSRGRWYDHSWKGDLYKSGGVTTNIGIHFFDMLYYLFGKCQQNTVHVLEPRRAAGFLEFEKARVRWFLSVDSKDLPKSAVDAKKTTFRSVEVNGELLEFSDGFTDLHTRSYEEILKGNGFGLHDAMPSIEIVSTIKNSTPVGFRGDYHEILKGIAV
jgi:UDP-N-acetyl-2-amino-2-deoxyglucuronate dehydrogenase